MRRFIRVGIVAVGLLLTGCTVAPQPAPAPTDGPADLTEPGRAADMIDQLMAAAGSTHVINAELSRQEAHVTVVTGETASTWAWRDARIAQVDSDVDYVGQTIFDPRGFGLTDLGDLFDQAAQVAGSDQDQELQIGDYDSGHVFMSVTTTPETRPVFFTTGGKLIGAFDPTEESELGPVLSQVVGQADEVDRLGLLADGSVYVDLPAGEDQVLRVVRSPQFPVREQLRSQWPGPPPISTARSARASASPSNEVRARPIRPSPSTSAPGAST